MGIIDRFRIENAVQTYDFWLELRGMRSRRRKEARRELRTNLRDAAADVGVTQALFNIGSPKELAYAMTPEATQRPRWSLGAMWASLAFVVVVFGLMYTASTFTSGVDASGVVGQQVTGFVFPWFGVDFMARRRQMPGDFRAAHHMAAIGAKHLDEPPEQRLHRFAKLGTIDLRIDYLRPGIGSHFELRAEVLRLGSRVATTRMEFLGADGKLLSSGAAAYIVS